MGWIIQGAVAGDRQCEHQRDAFVSPRASGKAVIVSESLRRFGAWLRGSRHRRLLHKALGQNPQQHDEAREAALLGLIDAQIEPWRQRPPLRGERAVELLQDLNRRFASLHVFEVDARHVDVWKKPVPLKRQESEPGEARMYAKRANHYRTLMTEVAKLSRSDDRFLLAMDLADIPMQHDAWPVFGFQKRATSTNLLLPDVDFFHHAWYQDDSDPLQYEEKSNTACFVGSSTGASLDANAVEHDTSPRLHLASRFVNDERVVFKIAHAAHCDTEATRRLLMAKPYYADPMRWDEQLKHRFLLSIDGNGATCSRMVKSLRSHGVLVKFQSEYGLYYFPLLRPGQHLLEVASPEQVWRILDLESQQPGHHRAVAAAGQDFAARYLSAPAVVQYTRLMLQQYSAMLRGTKVSDAKA